MTLQEAFDSWKQQDENHQLYVNTRNAFRMAWFNLPTNKPCSYYTKEILGEALAATREVESNKAKAASVMIHVLTYAHTVAPDDNPLPAFTLDHLMSAARRRVTVGTDPSVRSPMAQGGLSPSVIPPAQPEGKSPSVTPPAPPSTPTPKSSRPLPSGRKPGKAPKPVAQINPKTLKVVKIWPCMNDAERGTGANKICRCVTQLTMSGGFYWCLISEVDTFKARLEAKKQRISDVHKKDHLRKNREAKPEPEAMRDVQTTPAPPDSGGEAAAPEPKLEPKKLNVSMQIKVPEPEAMRDVQTTPAPPDSGGEAAALSPLSSYTDDDLFAELDRRGYKGELTRTQVITIGARNSDA